MSMILATGGAGWTAGRVFALALVTVAAVAGYALACALWPFAACGRCSGAGKRRSPSGRYWRTCPACGGAGKRLRTGRRVFTFMRERGADPRRTAASAGWVLLVAAMSAVAGVLIWLGGR